VAALQSPERPGLVYADFNTVNAEGRHLYGSGIGEFSLERFLSKQTWVPQPSAFFRSAILEELKGWNPDYFVCDTEFWLRLIFRYPARKVAGVWAERRLHEEQRNKKVREIVASYWKMTRESADLKAAPAELRRAAKCGALLTELRYNPSGSTFAASRLLWRAIAAYPPIWPSMRQSPLLIPGRMQLASLRNRVGRWWRARSAGNTSHTQTAGSPSS
jgi:hypothetical protein